MFVVRTRLVQVADLVGGVQTMLATPVVVRTFAGQVVQTVPDAVALLPAGQRPATTDLWKYALQWEVDAYAVPTIRGVVAGTGTLVFDADFWNTKAEHDAAPTAPLARNTFAYQFTSGRVTAGVGQAVLAAVDDWLLRAGLNGWTGDLRDPRVAVSRTPADDPLGLLANPTLQSVDGQPYDLPATWRPASF